MSELVLISPDAAPVLPGKVIGREPSLAAPDDQRRAPVQSVFERRPLAVTLLLAFAGALLLQLWRPCFFLTGDTISACLPPATEFYRQIWEGHWPFYDPYLFGGFSLLQDLGLFSLLSPWALLFSFLARTPYYFLLPDIVGTLSLVTAAGAFGWSALRLRRQFALPIPPWLIVLLSLSYAFTPFNFLVGASWIGFLSAPAALPLVLAGACERDWRKALAIQTAGVAYALFGGHMHPFMLMGLFSSGLVAVVGATQRRWQPLAVWAAAGAIPLLLALPLLWPAMTSFQQSDRASAGISVLVASRFNVPAAQLLSSFFLGPVSSAFLPGITIDLADPLFNLSIAFALVNLPLLGLLCLKRRWTALEGGLLGLLLLCALSVVRPDWLGHLFARLPLLHSLRWPFREITLLSFCAHALFLLAYRPAVTSGARRVVIAAGTVGATVYALVFLCLAPTLWLFEPDRRLIMSGEADRYWSEMKGTGGPGAGGRRFVIESPWEAILPQRIRVPFSVIGGFNYAALFRVNNVSGFSVTPPPSAAWLKRDTGVEPYFWGGIFSPQAVARIQRAHPDIQRIVLTSATSWQVFDGAEARAFQYDQSTGRVQNLPSPNLPTPP